MQRLQATIGAARLKTPCKTVSATSDSRRSYQPLSQHEIAKRDNAFEDIAGADNWQGAESVAAKYLGGRTHGIVLVQGYHIGDHNGVQRV